MKNYAKKASMLGRIISLQPMFSQLIKKVNACVRPVIKEKLGFGATLICDINISPHEAKCWTLHSCLINEFD